MMFVLHNVLASTYGQYVAYKFREAFLIDLTPVLYPYLGLFMMVNGYACLQINCLL